MLIGHSRVSVKLVSAGTDNTCGYRRYDQKVLAMVVVFARPIHANGAHPSELHYMCIGMMQIK